MTDNTYSIRRIEKKDFNELLSLFKEFSIFEKLPEKMINTVDKMNAESDLINGFVAENSDNKIIGYVTYFYAYYTWVGKSLYMDDLFVKQEYRGNGLGTRLIRKVIDFAKKENCNRLRWQVSEWNRPAIDFYKSLGAKISGVEQNCDLIF